MLQNTAVVTINWEIWLLFLLVLLATCRYCANQFIDINSYNTQTSIIYFMKEYQVTLKRRHGFKQKMWFTARI